MLDLVELERLEQVVVCSVLEASNGALHGAVRREEDHGDLGVELLDLTQQLMAVELGHSQVGQDEVEVTRSEALQSRSSVHRFFDLGSEVAQEAGQHLPLGGVVVYNQKSAVESHRSGILVRVGRWEPKHRHGPAFRSIEKLHGASVLLRHSTHERQAEAGTAGAVGDEGVEEAISQLRVEAAALVRNA